MLHISSNISIQINFLKVICEKEIAKYVKDFYLLFTNKKNKRLPYHSIRKTCLHHFKKTILKLFFTKEIDTSKNFEQSEFEIEAKFRLMTNVNVTLDLKEKVLTYTRLSHSHFSKKILLI